MTTFPCSHEHSQYFTTDESVRADAMRRAFARALELGDLRLAEDIAAGEPVQINRERFRQAIAKARGQ